MNDPATIPQSGTKFWFRPEVEKKIRKNDDLMLAIAKENGIRVTSVTRWFVGHDDELMKMGTLELIRASLGYESTSDLIEKQKTESE